MSTVEKTKCFGLVALVCLLSTSAIRPKDGYDRVRWNSAAKLIWSEDLEKDNTILFRVIIEDPALAQSDEP
jgi:hypothetical protein